MSINRLGWRIRGHFWSQTQGHWRRWLIRCRRDTLKNQFAELVWVDASGPICLHCLSTDIELHVTPTATWYLCHSCLLDYRLGL